MNTIVMRILSVLIGYAFGSIQSAYLLGKTRGIDIRDYGSGNAGTTNTIRVLGTKAGILVFFMDAFKCVFAVMAAWYLFGRSNPEMAYLFKSYAFAGCVLGHDSYWDMIIPSIWDSEAARALPAWPALSAPTTGPCSRQP